MTLDIPPTPDAIRRHLQTQIDRTSAGQTDGDVMVREEMVNVWRGRCRVAVIISPYGTHLEIGPVQGWDSQITWTFGQDDLDGAVTLLHDYLTPTQ